MKGLDFSCACCCFEIADRKLNFTALHKLPTVCLLPIVSFRFLSEGPTNSLRSQAYCRLRLVSNFSQKWESGRNTPVARHWIDGEDRCLLPNESRSVQNIIIKRIATRWRWNYNIAMMCYKLWLSPLGCCKRIVPFRKPQFLVKKGSGFQIIGNYSSNEYSFHCASSLLCYCASNCNEGMVTYGA